jgi:hypothetical protein
LLPQLRAGTGTPLQWAGEFRAQLPLPFASLLSLDGAEAVCHQLQRIDPASLAADAIRMGASLHQVREVARHADMRTTGLYFVCQEEDAEVAAQRIHIRITGRKGA